MAKHIWANPNDESWGGFRFQSYHLDVNKVLALALVEKHTSEDKVEEVVTNVEEILKKLSDRTVEIKSLINVLGMTIKTDKADLYVDGPSFNIHVLEIVLKIRNEGANPFTAQWFYYDQSSCMDEPHEMYSFFVVDDEKIVRERVLFSDYFHNGFDPSIFVTYDDQPMWNDEEAWDRASDLYWYRKFCSETRTGQVMSLRSDNPELLSLANGSQTREGEGGPAVDVRGPSPAEIANASLLQGMIAEVRIVRWILVVLGLLVLLALWK